MGLNEGVKPGLFQKGRFFIDKYSGGSDLRGIQIRGF